jgi:hypothetical protein
VATLQERFFLADKFSRKIAWWQHSVSSFFGLTNLQEKLLGGNNPRAFFLADKFSRKNDWWQHSVSSFFG